jgi:hypothetical protein
LNPDLFSASFVLNKTSFSFQLVNGYTNGSYVVKLKLAYHIPEYLPMFGKKARVYYHGIPGFCVSCHETGHVKNDCDSNSISWRDYIKKLIELGIPKPLFGSWLATNLTSSRVSHVDIEKPNLKKAKESDSESDSDDDLSSIPPQMQKLFRKFLASTPNHSSFATSSKNSTGTSNNNSNRKKTDPKKASNKEEKRSPSQNRNRNRGRGRGRGTKRDTSATRGGGRGRGQQ